MLQKELNKNKNKTTRVVGTIHVAEGFSAAQQCASTLDMVEIRADLLSVETIREGVKMLKLPYIFTVRHPEEGGGGDLTTSQRRARYLTLWEGASAVDIEMRSLRGLRDVWDQAREKQMERIASWHDFKRTPSRGELHERIRRGIAHGADIVKVATFLQSPSDLGRLLALFDEEWPCALAVMGMGPLGRVSRLVLAAAGSTLNYGWLARPQVPGQWPAAEFRTILNKAMTGDEEK